MLRAIVLTSMAVLGCCGCGKGSGVHSGPCQDYGPVALDSSLWMDLTPPDSDLAADHRQTAAYDPRGDRLIVHRHFGAITWVLENASGVGGSPVWTELTPKPDPAPPNRPGAAAAYHQATDTFILVGGLDEGQLGSPTLDVWLLRSVSTPGAAEWSLATVAGAPPSPRSEMAVAYDEAHDVIYLFGGTTRAYLFEAGSCSDGTRTLHGDTMILTDVTTNPTWSNAAPMGDPELPPPRESAAAAWDPVNERLFLFGGFTASCAPQGDTWVLDYLPDSVGGPVLKWRRWTPAGNPPPRGRHTLVFDASRQRLILFGGIDTQGQRNDETWILADIPPLLDDDEAAPAWAIHQTGKPRPTGRYGHAAVFAPEPSNRMIVFGGTETGGFALDELWVLRHANGVPSDAVATTTILAASTVVCIGAKLQLTGQAVGTLGEVMQDVAFSWESDDPTVARVDRDGLVKALAAGSTTITGTPGLPGPSAELTITVIAPPQPDAGGSGCSGDDDCSAYCTLPPMRPGTLGADSNGGFCVAGACTCCFAICGVDPATGQAGNCECYTCSANANCTFDSNLTCHAAQDVCVFE
jgi:hypothetical protein